MDLRRFRFFSPLKREALSALRSRKEVAMGEGSSLQDRSKGERAPSAEM